MRRVIIIVVSIAALVLTAVGIRAAMHGGRSLESELRARRQVLEADATLNAVPPGARLAARSALTCDRVYYGPPMLLWRYESHDWEGVDGFYDARLTQDGWQRASEVLKHRSNELADPRWKKRFNGFKALAGLVTGGRIPTARGSREGFTFWIEYDSHYPSFCPEG
jgi:hypothetical protein